MKIEDRLKGYRILEEPTAREEKIMETVRASQNAFFEREQEQQLSRWEFLWIQMKFIRNLEMALVRIENKTYGICKTTGKLIPKERLMKVPHATECIEAKEGRR